jgi:hypothetical protein
MPRKTFTQLIQEQITHENLAKSMPWQNLLPESSHRIQTLQTHLRTFSRYLRHKRRWLAPPAVRRSEEYRQAENDAVNIAIAKILHKYREKGVSRHLTKDSADFVINEVRAWVEAQYSESKVRTYLTDDAVKCLASTSLFSSRIDETVRELEGLRKAGVIDIIEYYFLLASYKRRTTRYASELIDWSNNNGRACLFHARRKIEAHLSAIDAGEVVSTPPNKRRGRPRGPVDHDVLMNAIRHLVDR